MHHDSRVHSATSIVICQQNLHIMQNIKGRSTAIKCVSFCKYFPAGAIILQDADDNATLQVSLWAPFCRNSFPALHLCNKYSFIVSSIFDRESITLTVRMCVQRLVLASKESAD